MWLNSKKETGGKHQQETGMTKSEKLNDNGSMEDLNLIGTRDWIISSTDNSGNNNPFKGGIIKTYTYKHYTIDEHIGTLKNKYFSGGHFFRVFGFKNPFWLPKDMEKGDKQKLDGGRTWFDFEKLDFKRITDFEKIGYDQMLEEVMDTDISSATDLIKKDGAFTRLYESISSKSEAPEYIVFIETVRDFYNHWIPTPFSTNVIAKIAIKKGMPLKSLDEIKDLLYGKLKYSQSGLLRNTKEDKTSEEIEYNGYYINKVAIGGKDYFQVQSNDNKKKGIKKGFGDALESTFDEAKSTIDRQIAKDERDKNREQEWRKEQEIETVKKTEKSKQLARSKDLVFSSDILNVYIDKTGLTPIQSGRLNDQLDKKWIDSKKTVYTIRERLSKGKYVDKQENSGGKFNRSYFNNLTDTKAQEEYTKRLDSKKTYDLVNNDGTFIEVPKVIYDAIVFDKIEPTITETEADRGIDLSQSKIDAVEHSREGLDRVTSDFIKMKEELKKIMETTKIYRDKGDRTIKYWAEEQPSGKWLVYSESPRWTKRFEDITTVSQSDAEMIMREMANITPEFPKNIVDKGREIFNADEKGIDAVGGEIEAEILNKKQQGSLFKGETWKVLVDNVVDYFLPKFNRPIQLTSKGSKLSDNFTKNYGELDIQQFIEDYKQYPNSEIKIKADKQSVILPKGVSNYLYKKLDVNNNEETFNKQEEELKPIRTLSTGDNVYAESSNYRLNDNKYGDKGKYILNLTTDKNTGGVSDAHYYFNDLTQALEITKKLDDRYPNGYPEALLINKVIDGWISENKEVEETVDGNIYYTTATENYDGFGTKTIEHTDWLDSRNKPIRKIFVPTINTEWQINRNASGNNGTFTEEEFNKFQNLFHKKEIEMEKKYDIVYTNAGGVTVASNKLETKNGDYKTVAHISSNGDIKYFEELPPNIILDIEQMAKPQEISPERGLIIKSVMKEKKTAYNYVYDRLLKVAPDLLDFLSKAEYTSDIYGKSQYRTQDFGGDSGYMYLAVEGLDKDDKGRYILALSHYYKQYGDLMCDPCMTVRLDPEIKTVEALTFKMDGIIGRGIIKEVYGLTKDGKEGVNLREKKAQNSFLNTWSSNWVKQGHKVEFRPLDVDAGNIYELNDWIEGEGGIEKVFEGIEERKQTPTKSLDDVYESAMDVLIPKYPFTVPQSETQKVLDEYPIVIEWSEGSEERNIGVPHLDELQKILKYFGFTDSPDQTYIKNKVWFRGYPSSVRIDVSLQQGDYNPEKDNLLEWLTNDDNNFDWTQFTTISKEAQEVIKPEWDKMQDFLAGEEAIMLEPLTSENPLSSQLKRLTGDSFNSIDFVNEGKGENDHLSSSGVLIHKKTGQRFIIPSSLKYFKGIEHQYKNAFELNKAIEEFLDSKSNDYIFSNEEKEFLYLYEGYGGLEKLGATKAETGTGLLYEYYTPKVLIEKMWGLAYKYGFNTGKVLEPSVGIGRFLDYTSATDSVTGYEVNPYSARICRIIHPKSKIILSSFAEHFYNGNTYNPKFETGFDLVIGNPPYGKNVDRRSTPEAKRIGTAITQYEHYFILRGLDCLKSGGLLIYVSTANLFTKGYDKVKERISEKADLVDGYLLPNSTFKQTKINTSLIVLRRK